MIRECGNSSKQSTGQSSAVTDQTTNQQHQWQLVTVISQHISDNIQLPEMGPTHNRRRQSATVPFTALEAETALQPSCDRPNEKFERKWGCFKN